MGWRLEILFVSLFVGILGQLFPSWNLNFPDKFYLFSLFLNETLRRFIAQTMDNVMLIDKNKVTKVCPNVVELIYEAKTNKNSIQLEDSRLHRSKGCFKVYNNF